jgi:hypothetical protein
MSQYQLHGYWPDNQQRYGVKLAILECKLTTTKWFQGGTHHETIANLPNFFLIIFMVSLMGCTSTATKEAKNNTSRHLNAGGNGIQKGDIYENDHWFVD